jgi:beta-phosphoglucomutase-like phosphatase (HAD superfamily)
MFDGFLSARARSSGRPFVPFDVARDYSLVDGKLRDDGTRSFLASRSIQLPEGTGDDPATAETIQGLGKLKNGILFALMREQGVEAYPGSVRYVRAVRDAGPRTAVVSSSENCHEVLIAAGIADLFDARIDGVVAAELHLAAEVGHLRLALDYAAEAALMDLQDIEHNLKNIFKA